MWKPVLKLASSGKLRLAGHVLALASPFYRVCFLAGASSSGLLRALSEGPRSFGELAATFAPTPAAHEGLRAYLDFGVRIGELSEEGRGFTLRGFLARRLAKPENDAWAAIVEETASLHHALLVHGPERLKRGDRSRSRIRTAR